MTVIETETVDFSDSRLTAQSDLRAVKCELWLDSVQSLRFTLGRRECKQTKTQELRGGKTFYYSLTQTTEKPTHRPQTKVTSSWSSADNSSPRNTQTQPVIMSWLWKGAAVRINVSWRRRRTLPGVWSPPPARLPMASPQCLTRRKATCTDCTRSRQTDSQQEGLTRAREKRDRFAAGATVKQGNRKSVLHQEESEVN